MHPPPHHVKKSARKRRNSHMPTGKLEVWYLQALRVKSHKKVVVERQSVLHLHKVLTLCRGKERENIAMCIRNAMCLQSVSAAP